jgi:uncharacterized protein (DUF3820 family)
MADYKPGSNPFRPDPTVLKELLTYRMPFGKHKGQRIRDLSTPYLEWFARQGWPENRLGVLLETMHLIKQENLMEILYQLERIERTK